ncbi:FAD synthase [Candidatus Woesearchaeota archaeon]|nr:FAD synthase [Candidatus Woesearchaeota archaeon]
MHKVMVFGTFDVIHTGHLYFLNQAKQHGDYLVVIIARDKTVEMVKGKKPLTPELQRKSRIELLAMVDEARLGQLEDKYADIRAIQPDVICLGYDQTAFVDKLPAKLESFGLSTKIVRMGFHAPRRSWRTR